MLKIWGRQNFINVQKVLWCCEELGLPFQRVNVGGSFGGNDEPWYLALNPTGLVPTVSDEGFVLWEPNAIVRYLASRYGVGTLWPENPQVRAEADQVDGLSRHDHMGQPPTSVSGFNPDAAGKKG